MSTHFSELRRLMSRTSERHNVHRNLAAVISTREGELGIERLNDPCDEGEARPTSQPTDQGMEDL